jgi:uncharacterized protein YndB with AHSA1/START domain
VAIDVTARVVINRPRAEVAAFIEDAANDLQWIRALTSVEPLSEGTMRTGYRVRRVAKMMGRAMPYVTEVKAYEPARTVEMETSESPFPMLVTYTLSDAGEGATEMTIRNRGGAGLMFKVAGPLIGRMVNGRVQGDLRQLKAVLEKRA